MARTERLLEGEAFASDAFHRDGTMVSMMAMRDCHCAGEKYWSAVTSGRRVAMGPTGGAMGDCMMVFLRRSEWRWSSGVRWMCPLSKKLKLKLLLLLLLLGASSEVSPASSGYLRTRYHKKGSERGQASDGGRAIIHQVDQHEGSWVGLVGYTCV